MTPQGLAAEVKSERDIPIVSVPRTGPAPLRVEFSVPNDGTAKRMTALVINACEIPFHGGRLRLVLEAGAYRARNAEVEQTFNSDDGQKTILDLLFDVPPKSRIEIMADPQ